MKISKPGMGSVDFHADKVSIPAVCPSWNCSEQCGFADYGHRAERRTGRTPGTGVRHGPCAQHGHRTGPQGTPGCRRVRMGTHFPLQIPKGPPAWPQCGPDDRNLSSKPTPPTPIGPSNCIWHPHHQALGGLGPWGVLVQPMWGLGGLGFDPEAALVN